MSKEFKAILYLSIPGEYGLWHETRFDDKKMTPRKRQKRHKQKDRL